MSNPSVKLATLGPAYGRSLTLNVRVSEMRILVLENLRD